MLNKKYILEGGSTLFFFKSKKVKIKILFFKKLKRIKLKMEFIFIKNIKLN